MKRNSKGQFMKWIAPLPPSYALKAAVSDEALQAEVVRINAALRLGKRTITLNSCDERMGEMVKQQYWLAGWRYVSIAWRKQRLVLTLGA